MQLKLPGIALDLIEQLELSDSQKYKPALTGASETILNNIEQTEKEAETALDAEWEQDLESFEIEDPVRTYLREIGRVSLLKKSDERILARRIEACRRIQVIEAKPAAFERSGSPRAWMCMLHLLKHICDSDPLVDALSRYLGQEGQRTLPDTCAK